MKSFLKASLKAVRKLAAYSSQSPTLILSRSLLIAKREVLAGIHRRAMLWLYLSGYKQLPSSNWNNLYPYPDGAGLTTSELKVSVIVPNYNHAAHLPQRLDSIFGQDYSNYEVILLDDCSTDDSREILSSYQKRYPNRTQCFFNSQNSGGVFYQWAKGLRLATGDLVWIAESDDYCSKNLLSELVKPFANKAVKIAFAKTFFVSSDQDQVIWTTEDYLHDLGLSVWSDKFLASANTLTKNAWVVKNVIPNVSSAVFRHPGNLALLADPNWQSMRLCGDWIFYLAVARGGLVAYSPEPTNYYRQHSMNISVKAQAEAIYYKEHYIVRDYLAEFYPLSPSDLDRQRLHVYRHWCVKNGLDKQAQFNAVYTSLPLAKDLSGSRILNIAIVTYALVAGGGETLPLMIANLLHRRGHTVIVIDFDQLPSEPGVEAMLEPSIPLFKLTQTPLLHSILTDLGVEIVHSHHAWVDMAIAALLPKGTRIKHVVTMHGMYELMTPELFLSLNNNIETIDAFVYTADKNLVHFADELRARKPFLRINNAVIARPCEPVSRNDINIAAADFVLCMVARGIPEKGWQEAIEAVLLANHHSPRTIHLLLIGDGAEPERLRPIYAHEAHIHFLDFQSNIRAFFACADMGFIPSRFQGESFPLVLIDCLATGRPVLASAIGEIPLMLATSQGLAGMTFPLVDWQVPVQSLGLLIAELANQPDRYEQMLRCVPEAASQFDPESMVRAYEELYCSLLVSPEPPPPLVEIHPGAMEVHQG